MTINKVTKKDFLEWLKMGTEFWTKRSKQEIKNEFERITSSKKEVSFICHDESSAVGFIALSLRSDYVEGSDFKQKTKQVGYLEAIYVRSKYRNKGIAKDLMKVAEKWFKEKQVKEIGSDVEVHNLVSQKFHKKIGFKKGETLIHYIKKLK